jgi:hypothetical protein
MPSTNARGVSSLPPEDVRPGGGGGDIGDVFKQALGDFAKSAIDGLLKSK